MFGERAIDWVILHLVGTVTLFLGVLALSRILRRHQAPSVTLAWLLFMAFVPYAAVPLYFFLGGRKLERAKASKQLMGLVPAADGGLPPAPGNLKALLRGYGLPGASASNRAVFHSTGKAAYDTLAAMIDDAKESIWIATFVFGNDDVSRDIVERLARKARAGLEVCLLVDGLGSFKTPRRIYRPLIEAAGHVVVFSPVIHRMFRGRAYLRNHRKMVIADRGRVLTGGINIASEYLGPTANTGRWKDIGVLIEGDAVEDFCRIFESDWIYAAGKDEPLKRGAPPRPPSWRPEMSTTLQVVPSGPDVAADLLYDAILQSCFQARFRVWIVTPYFIPDETLLQGLLLAARRGADVRVLVPRRSNHPLTDWARSSYLRDLAGAGARIFFYPKVMVHAKAVLFDNTVAMVGSANMDVRSLRLNYEAMIFAYDGPLLQDIESWLTALFEQADEGVMSANPPREIVEGLSRLLAPQL